MRGARDDTERARGTSTTPPFAARSARRTQAVVSRRASMAAPKALHRSGPAPRSGTTRWSTREEKRPNRRTIPRDARPALLSSFRLRAMASRHWMLVGTYLPRPFWRKTNNFRGLFAFLLYHVATIILANNENKSC